MVNQVNPLQMTNPGYTYCHALNHVFKECPVYLAQQMLPDNMNAAFARLNNNPYSKTLIRYGESGTTVISLRYGVDTGQVSSQSAQSISKMVR